MYILIYRILYMQFEEAFWIWEGVETVSHLKTKGVGKEDESSGISKVGRHLGDGRLHGV